MEAFRFSPDGQIFGYYDRNGNDLGASFIRSPVAVGRVSSRFSHKRLHPILGVVRQHLGVDLAAPRGTPVMAAADGKVISVGANGGFGLQVVLAHSGGYRTFYGHLSRFKEGLRPGQSVRQKQVIGYVGSSGLATGPHLDYRLQQHGVFKNPFAIKFQPRNTLKGAELLALTTVIDETASLLAEGASERLLTVKALNVKDDQQLTLL